MLIKRDMSTELYWMLENPSTRNDGMCNDGCNSRVKFRNPDKDDIQSP